MGGGFFITKLVLDFLDLEAVEFDWSFTAKHIDQDFDLTLVLIDFIDHAVEAFEGSVDDVDGFTDGEVDLELRFFYAHALLDVLDFVFGDRSRGSTGTHETCDVRRIADDIPRIFGDVHLHEYVTREDTALDDAAATVLDFNLVFLRDNDVKNLVGHVHGLYALAQVFGDAVFVAGIRMNYVPVLGWSVCIGHELPFNNYFLN